MARSVKKYGDTRRQRQAKYETSFAPIRELIRQMKADAVDAVRGEPVLHAWGHRMSAAETLSAFGRCFQRLTDADLSIIQRVAKKLEVGVPITRGEVDLMESRIDLCAVIYQAATLDTLRSAIRTEEIAFAFEELQGCQ